MTCFKKSGYMTNEDFLFDQDVIAIDSNNTVFHVGIPSLFCLCHYLCRRVDGWPDGFIEPVNNRVTKDAKK